MKLKQKSKKSRQFLLRNISLLSISSFLLLESIIPSHGEVSKTKEFKNQMSNSIKVERMGDKMGALKTQKKEERLVKNIDNNIEDFLKDPNYTMFKQLMQIKKDNPNPWNNAMDLLKKGNPKKFELLNHYIEDWYPVFEKMMEITNKVDEEIRKFIPDFQSNQINEAEVQRMMQELGINYSDYNSFRYAAVYLELINARQKILHKYDMRIEEIKNSKESPFRDWFVSFLSNKRKKTEEALEVCDRVIKEIVKSKIKELNKKYDLLISKGIKEGLYNGSYNEAVSHLLIGLSAAELSSYGGDYDKYDKEAKSEFAQILKAFQENGEINLTQMDLWDAKIIKKDGKEIKYDARVQTDINRLPFSVISGVYLDLAKQGKVNELNQIEIGNDNLNKKQSSHLYIYPDVLYYSAGGTQGYLHTAFEITRNEHYDPSRIGSYRDWVRIEVEIALKNKKLNIYHVPGEGNIPIFYNKKDQGTRYETIKLLSVVSFKNAVNEIQKIEDPEAAAMLLKFIFKYSSLLYSTTTRIASIDNPENIKTQLDRAQVFAGFGLPLSTLMIEKVESEIKKKNEENASKAAPAAFFALVENAISDEKTTNIGAFGYGSVTVTKSERNSLVLLAQKRASMTEAIEFIKSLDLSLTPLAVSTKSELSYEDSKVKATITLTKPENYKDKPFVVYLNWQGTRINGFSAVLPQWTGSRKVTIDEKDKFKYLPLEFTVYPRSWGSKFKLMVSGNGLNCSVTGSKAEQSIPQAPPASELTPFPSLNEYSVPVIPTGVDLISTSITYLLGLDKNSAIDPNKNPLLQLRQFGSVYNSGRLNPSIMNQAANSMFNLLQKLDLSRLQKDVGSIFTQEDYNKVKNWVERCRNEGKYIKDIEAEKSLSKSKFGEQVALNVLDKPVVIKSSLYTNRREAALEWNPDGTFKGINIINADVITRYDVGYYDSSGVKRKVSYTDKDTVNGLSIMVDILGIKGKVGMAVSPDFKTKLYTWDPSQREYILNSLFYAAEDLIDAIGDISKLNDKNFIQKVGLSTVEFLKFLGESVRSGINSTAIQGIDTVTQSQRQYRMNITNIPPVPFPQLAGGVFEKTADFLENIPWPGKILKLPFRGLSYINKLDADISPYVTGIINVNNNGVGVNKDAAYRIGGILRAYGFSSDIFITQTKLLGGKPINLGAELGINMKQYGNLIFGLQLIPEDPSTTSIGKLLHGEDTYLSYYVSYNIKFGKKENSSKK